MATKKFKEFLNENILDDEEDIDMYNDDEEDEEDENNWEVRINGKPNSYWEYKYDAIENIIEILDSGGDNSSFDDYTDEDGEELSKYEIVDLLNDMDESDFYDKLEELKDYVGYNDEIKLINLSDEDEIEFLDEE
jgi:hypothetical protein